MNNPIQSGFTFVNMPSESSRYRHLVERYLLGNGVDLGSGGCPIVPHAIQVDLPTEAFLKYNSGNLPETPIQWRGDALNLPFKDGVLDWCFSSHLLEDFADWRPSLTEWIRVLKPGGRLVILIPDKERWNAAVAAGQPPNCAHQHEGCVGELTSHVADMGLHVLEDRLTDLSPEDYSILFVAQKL